MGNYVSIILESLSELDQATYTLQTVTWPCVVSHGLLITLPQVAVISRRDIKPQSWRTLWVHQLLWSEQLSWLTAFQDMYSLNSKTSYRQISSSLEDAIMGVIMNASIFNLTGAPAALLPNGRASEQLSTHIPAAKFGNEMFHRKVTDGPANVINFIVTTTCCKMESEYL